MFFQGLNGGSNFVLKDEVIRCLEVGGNGVYAYYKLHKRDEAKKKGNDFRGGTDQVAVPRKGGKKLLTASEVKDREVIDLKVLFREDKEDYCASQAYFIYQGKEINIL